ncbi:polysaccharide pyruvyl transferase family protein [Rhodococcus sp. X156]|uniref:polysaccharide pyruvyl transferase family protein n=1 Tax=Rhodococcus sp. X156 TaxID=2499145 RepID=UPI001F49A198|nr:polysaccharide pyruvyl transferase family protein [Rhodococcus sp. X156]
MSEHRVRVLVVGWPSLLHGEATAGDVLSMQAVGRALARAGTAHELAWSAVMCPPEGLRLDDADPARFTHLVFACGPLAGAGPTQLHRRFAGLCRIAVGVSVLDAADPAVAGFDHVIARDAPGVPAQRDLAARHRSASVPVLGVYLTRGQAEYGPRRRHPAVVAALQGWLSTVDAARLDLDTRLDPRDWRLAATPGQIEALLRRLDAVVTMRMHGLVLALKNGVPALAVDPVAGGGKVSAQAHAWQWPAVVPAEEVGTARLHEQLAWCLSAAGRTTAAARAALPPAGEDQLARLLAVLQGGGAPR